MHLGHSNLQALTYHLIQIQKIRLRFRIQFFGHSTKPGRFRIQPSIRVRQRNESGTKMKIANSSVKMA